PRRRKHHVVARAAGDELRLQRLVLRVHVVVDADAGGRLEMGDGVRGHVVGPVVDVELLAAAAFTSGIGTGLAGAAGGEEQGAGKGRKAQGHGILHGGLRGGHVAHLPYSGGGVWCAHFRPSRARKTNMDRLIPRTALAASLLSFAALPAFSQDGGTDPAWEFGGELVAASDYVWRGVSQTMEDPALQL